LRKEGELVLPITTKMSSEVFALQNYTLSIG